MLAIEQANRITEEDYLQSESFSPVKREYIDGLVYAMTGASHNHSFISGNIFRKFGNHLEGSPCATFMSDTRVRMGKDYVYPDVLVDCNTISGDDFYSASPVIIVEVLSKSTRKFDTTLKLIRYINMPSLREYVLIEQDIVAVQVLRKSRHWLPEYFYIGDSVTFTSINLTLTVEEIYDRVDNVDMREFRQQKQSSLPI